MYAASRAARGAARAQRALSSSAAPTPGPKLPAGTDPSAYHPKAHALTDSNRWKVISGLFALPVVGFGIVLSMNEHKHAPAPVQYEYMRRASRSPRFPWGDDDLIGCPYEKEGHH